MAWIRRHSLAAYFVCAYAISWTLWLPRVGYVQGWWDTSFPEWWHYLGAAGPVSAALLVAALLEGPTSLKSLLRQYLPSRAPRGWLAFAVLSPLLLLAIGLVGARLADGRWPAYDELANAANLPHLGLALTLAIQILTFGIGEETGWRGFALPRLQSRVPALKATTLLAVGWGLWHLPSFFENDSMRAMSAFAVVGWAFGLWLGAVFLTWLYNSSKGSLLVIVLWHGLFNQFAASEASDVLPAVMTVGIMAIAIGALWLAGPGELTGLSRRGGKRQQVALPN